MLECQDYNLVMWSSIPVMDFCYATSVWGGPFNGL